MRTHCPGPPLERSATIEDDRFVDRKFFKLPTRHLVKFRANESDRGHIGVGRILIGDEATDNGPVVGIGLWMQVRHIELDMIVAQRAEHDVLLHQMLRHLDDNRVRGHASLNHGQTGREKSEKGRDNSFHRADRIAMISAVG